MKTMRIAGVIVGSAACLLIGQARADVVVFDTLGLSTSGSISVDGVSGAQSFVALGANMGLKEVILGMANSSGSGTFTVSIYDNAGNIPGSLLTTLNGPSSPTVAGDYTYTPGVAGFSMIAGTTYWVVASDTTASPYKWAVGTGSPSPGTDIGLGADSGFGWFNAGTGHLGEMEIVAVPEAATYLMDGVMVLAAGFGVYYFRRKTAATA